MSVPASPLVVRAPNHLGDLVMALPSLAASGRPDVVVTRWLAPLLDLANEAAGERGEPPPVGRVLPLDRGTRAMVGVAGTLRAARYERGVLLTPSVSSAILFALGGVRRRRGTDTDGRRILLHEAVPVRDLPPIHRASLYHWLLADEIPSRPPVPRLGVPERHRERFRALRRGGGAPLVGIFPGSNAPSRRWDPERFAAVARDLARQGWEVAVFGAGSERDLTARVAGERALDLGGRTDLALLAAGLATCSVVLSNDSGPLHLAAAVGTPTVSLWGAGDPAATGVVGEIHRIVRRPDLPCVPCVKNECPRHGAGYYLPDAHKECLGLIEVGPVEEMVRSRLERIRT